MVDQVNAMRAVLRSAACRAQIYKAAPCKMQWNSLFFLLVVSLSVSTACAQPKRTFTLEDDRFVRDGKPIQLISGRSIMHACIKTIDMKATLAL